RGSWPSPSRAVRRAADRHQGRIERSAGSARADRPQAGPGRPLMRVADGLVVTLEYTVRVASGVVLDSTGQCGPVSILAGAGQLFPALEDRLGNLAAGETKTFRIPPEEAYGPRDPALVRPIPRGQLPADLEVGGEYRLKAQPGRALRFRVVEIGPEVVQ